MTTPAATAARKMAVRAVARSMNVTYLKAERFINWEYTPAERAALAAVLLTPEVLAEALHAIQHPDHALTAPGGDWCRNDVVEDAAAILAALAARGADRG